MKIVIVGGGFAGMNLAKSLSDKPNVEVVLVDKNNYHFFPPLLYQVATSFIEASNISYPFRKMFQGSRNVRFLNGTLQKIDTENDVLLTDTCNIHYDVLVLATGTVTNFFGMEQVQQRALPMKNIDDALQLRNQLLLNLEHATRTNDEEELQKLTTVVIAGGGPTGVEIAGMMAEMNRHIIAKDYPELNKHPRNIYLIDAAASLLGPMSKKAQEEAFETLKQLGVHILLNKAVKDYRDQTVMLSDGTELKTANLIWASGVQAAGAPGLPENAITRGARILVDEYNKVRGTENVYAIGDVCFQSSDPEYPNGHPQLAQVAIQQGKNLARNLLKLAGGDTALKAFRYKNKGSMAIISKFKAVVDLPNGFFKGFLAWLTWLFIHIIPIAGFRNKIKLALNWFWSFISNDPTLRLIIRPHQDPNNRLEKEI
jgi:NADH dehydrogenase